MIGNFGQAEVFSFHATKFVNSFEGGAVVTNQDQLAEKVRWMINFGFRGYDNVVSLGTNGKMGEISAAMGITSLESMDQFISKNYANYCLYHQVFDGLPGVKIITYDKREKNNYQYIVVEIDQQTTGIDRDLLFKILLAENILARRYFYPGCHAMEPYRADASASQHVLPETEKLSSKVLVFPNGTALEDDDIYTIGDIMNVVITNSGQIVDRLRL
jgi:dTDP-4-amino-4,6-dideoxygalactose transaminase